MDLRYEFYIGGTPEQVWNALVSPEATKQIYWGSIIESTFEAGSPMKYVGPGNDGDETVHVYGEVLKFEPNKVFSYTEHPGPSYYPNHAELETRVTFTLEPVGNCTKLTLVNDRWTEDHPSHDNANQGWWMILSNTKTWVETGKALDLGMGEES